MLPAALVGSHQTPTRFERQGADGGLTRYHLHIEPWLSFLAHRTDAWVFQDMNVLDITEAIFADHQAQGALQPAWRIDVADREALPRRSLCTQFNETDLAFLTRLWAEEGLFAWFEHEGAAGSEHLGRHTLVLADHNGACRPNAQAHIRYTQAGATLKEDALQQWDGVRCAGASELHTASWDHRAVSNHGASEHVAPEHGQGFALVHADQPGHYAYESPEQAQRRARLQREALQAARKQFEGCATVRTLAPGSTFTVHGHPELLQTLHANAQTHKAQLPGEAAPEQLPARKALAATLASLQATEGGQAADSGSDADADTDDASGNAGPVPIGGGQGRIDISARPDLVLSACGDIACATPASTVVAAGANVSVSTACDANLLAQRHQAWAVKDGISLFTRGEAKAGQRAVQDTGIKLHAASGNVRTEAQSGPFTLTAQKAIDLQSTAADIVITAPERIVLNGGGSYVKIEGSNIEIGTSGPAQFKAAMKELTGGGGASAGLSLKKAAQLNECPSKLTDAAMGGCSAI